MGALQVFVVRFFFQVCILVTSHYAYAKNIPGCTQGLRVNAEFGVVCQNWFCGVLVHRLALAPHALCIIGVKLE